MATRSRSTKLPDFSRDAGADESLMTPSDQALEAAREARVQRGVASILTVAGLDRHPPQPKP